MNISENRSVQFTLNHESELSDNTSGFSLIVWLVDEAKEISVRLTNSIVDPQKGNRK